MSYNHNQLLHVPTAFSHKVYREAGQGLAYLACIGDVT